VRLALRSEGRLARITGPGRWEKLLHG